MASQKKLKKSAEKAFDKAKDAVDDARRSAKKLSKKKRPSVTPLEKGLDKAKAELSAAKKKSASEPAKSAKPSKPATSAKPAASAKLATSTTSPQAEPAAARSIYTPPLPEVDETTVELPDGHDATVDLHAQTLVALRALARTKGITNVSRYTKAALVEKIQQA